MAGSDTSDRRSSSLHGVNVLVVEDDDDARELLTAVLAQRGAAVFSASSAAVGYDLAMRERVDVVLSDIAMPDEDGYALLRRLRALDRGARLPVLAVTAYASRSDRQRALDAGFDAHIGKPVDLSSLVSTIRDLVDRCMPRLRLV